MVQQLPPRHLAIIQELENLRRSIAVLEYEVIALLRDHGITWDTIGESLDPPISRQAAARRFSEPRRRRD